MFERIRCYANLRKHEKFLRGARKLALLTNDTEMMRLANNALHKHAYIKRKMWFDRTMAQKFNLDCLKYGF